MNSGTARLGAVRPFPACQGKARQAWRRQVRCGWQGKARRARRGLLRHGGAGSRAAWQARSGGRGWTRLGTEVLDGTAGVDRNAADSPGTSGLAWQAWIGTARTARAHLGRAWHGRQHPTGENSMLLIIAALNGKL